MRLRVLVPVLGLIGGAVLTLPACSSSSRDFGSNGAAASGGDARPNDGASGAIGTSSAAGSGLGGASGETGTSSAAGSGLGGASGKSGSDGPAGNGQGGAMAEGGTSSAGNAGTGAGGNENMGGATACPGQKACPNSQCVPLTGCCSNDDCAGGFACVSGACSTTTCQQGFDRVCKGKCIKGCCTPNDCPEGANATRSCNENTCSLTCKTDFDDCDGKLENGCEVDLRIGQQKGSINENCGKCGNTCNFPNSPDAGTSCTTQYNACNENACWAHFLYNESPYMCPLERPHATIDMGDCGGGCYYRCETGWSDCDSKAENGCETHSTECHKYPYYMY